MLCFFCYFYIFFFFFCFFLLLFFFFFFFQAEDGIRDKLVTGVQTCALPICDEVIDYVFKRYGTDHVALLGMYSTFKRRAAIRELGKVYGLPKTEIDHLARSEERRVGKECRCRWWADH